MPETDIGFQSIHDAFRPRILRYLIRVVGERGAEDLTQIVLLKVNKGLASFRGDSSLSTWIYRIATNCALDKLRAARKQALSCDRRVPFCDSRYPSRRTAIAQMLRAESTGILSINADKGDQQWAIVTGKKGNRKSQSSRRSLLLRLL